VALKMLIRSGVPVKPPKQETGDSIVREEEWTGLDVDVDVRPDARPQV
jgi:hypothetical protein